MILPLLFILCCTRRAAEDVDTSIQNLADTHGSSLKAGSLLRSRSPSELYAWHFSFAVGVQRAANAVVECWDFFAEA